MTTATAKPAKNTGEEHAPLMLSVRTSRDVVSLLNRLKTETGMSKQLIVNLGLYAFNQLSPAQRAALNKKHQPAG